MCAGVAFGDNVRVSDEAIESDTSEVDESVPEYPIAAFIDRVREKRSNQPNLPTTVSLIQCENGTKVYLVGTAHFSLESIADVKQVIGDTLPDVVVLELCGGRSQMLLMDEAELKRQIQEVKLMDLIKLHGKTNGVLHYLMLRFNKYIMDQMGMPPGGEFKAAFDMAAQQQHCHVFLGDRPVNVTLYRAFNSLGPWRKLKLLFTLLWEFEPISKADVEAMKNADMLEQLLQGLAVDYPELSKYILEERDQYLTRSIWEVTGLFSKRQVATSTIFDQVVTQYSTTPTVQEPEGVDSDDAEVHLLHRSPAQPVSQNNAMEPTNDSSDTVGPIHAVMQEHFQPIVQCCEEWPPITQLPRVVVAVVGIGHVAGIKKAWLTAGSIDKEKLMTSIKPPRSWVFCKWTIKGVVLSSVLYGGYYASLGLYRLGNYGVQKCISILS